MFGYSNQWKIIYTKKMLFNLFFNYFFIFRKLIILFIYTISSKVAGGMRQ